MTEFFNGITDAKWSIIKSLSPRKKTRFGRPYANFRYVINSILYVLVEGGRWTSIPRGKTWAPKSTAYGWLKKMTADGTLERILAVVVKHADRKGIVEWKNVSFDGTFSPGKGGGEDVEYGYKGKGSTIHLIVDGNGMALNATVTPANGDERLEVIPLLSKSHIRKDGSIENGHADKGYDAKHVRDVLLSFGIKPVIPYRNFKNRSQKRANLDTSKTRWKIERCFAWMKSKFRRIATRWERNVAIWKGFIDLAIIIMWIDKLVFG